MTYWVLQEAITGGSQAAASPWASAILSGSVVGAAVGFIGVVISQVLTGKRHSEDLKQARDFEERRTREAALQKYFEQIGKLLADEKRPLRRSTLGYALSTVARAQTLAVLVELDPVGKGILLQFLYESALVYKQEPVVSLTAPCSVDDPVAP